VPPRLELPPSYQKWDADVWKSVRPSGQQVVHSLKKRSVRQIHSGCVDAPNAVLRDGKQVHVSQPPLTSVRCRAAGIRG
jgi:hypothetical protein